MQKYKTGIIKTWIDGTALRSPLQIRQHEVPEGKHPLISVRQSRGQLIAVRSKPPSQAEPPPRELKLWDDCDVVKVNKI